MRLYGVLAIAVAVAVGFYSSICSIRSLSFPLSRSCDTVARLNKSQLAATYQS
ncbi:hypothetical protein BCV70DRAFT_197129 [Testicularia cyperi]|uniref:Uncharacterized protein n=1 Tax=Testicularia cyperi TaxID=1882483 RepID=A0A317XY65_9BASI|nr:hypothetical protein BCV70DRAFT_197129 [Testicularia cyperi]